jgi:hypothetical protein
MPKEWGGPRGHEASVAVVEVQGVMGGGESGVAGVWGHFALELDVSEAATEKVGEAASLRMLSRYVGEARGAVARTGWGPCRKRCRREAKEEDAKPNRGEGAAAGGVVGDGNDGGETVGDWQAVMMVGS